MCPQPPGVPGLYIAGLQCGEASVVQQVLNILQAGSPTLASYMPVGTISGGRGRNGFSALVYGAFPDAATCVGILQDLGANAQRSNRRGVVVSTPRGPVRVELAATQRIQLRTADATGPEPRTPHENPGVTNESGGGEGPHEDPGRDTHVTRDARSHNLETVRLATDIARGDSAPPFFRLGTIRLPDERIYGWGAHSLSIPGEGTQSYLYCVLISLGLWRLEVHCGRRPFEVARRAVVPDLQLRFWCGHALEVINAYAVHFASLATESNVVRLLATPLSWGSQGEHLDDDFQIQCSSPHIQSLLSALLVNLSSLPEACVGIGGCPPNLPAGLGTTSDLVSVIDRNPADGVIVAWDRLGGNRPSAPSAGYTATPRGRGRGSIMSRRGGRGRGARASARTGRAEAATSPPSVLSRDAATSDARSLPHASTSASLPQPVQLTAAQRTRIAQNRAAAIARRAKNTLLDQRGRTAVNDGEAAQVAPAPDQNANPVPRADHVATNANSAPIRLARQEALRRRLESDRLAALQQLDLADVDRPVQESASEVQQMIEGLPQEVRSMLETSCARSSVANPPAESLGLECASCRENYSAGEQVATTPCVHSMHLRCFAVWARADYETAAGMGVRWRPRCPQCNEPIG